MKLKKHKSLDIEYEALVKKKHYIERALNLRV